LYLWDDVNNVYSAVAGGVSQGYVDDGLALKEPLNVAPIADLKVKVYNLDNSYTYEDYGGGASLLKKTKTYTSGAQTITADFDIVQVSSLVVGNSFLQEGTQYTISGAVVTITDILTSGAVIQLKYWKANAVNATNYTKAESDAQLVVFTPEIGIAFTGIFNFTKYQASFANYTTAGSITLSAGVNPLPLSVNKVLIKGGITINLPTAWSKRGGAFSTDATQWNEIYVQYEAGYVTLVNTVLDTNFQPIATTTATDTTAPTAPTNLASPSKTDTTADLTWDASTDEVGVVSYNIFRDGVLNKNVPSNSGQLTGLTAETPYSFTVSALDAAGNQSAQSTAFTVTTNAAATGLDASYQAVLDYATTNAIALPDSAQQTIDNQLMIDYKATGAFVKEDAVGNFAGTATKAFKLICWKRLIQMVEIGTPIWNTTGVKGNGTDSAIDTLFVPFTDAVNFSLANSGVLFVRTVAPDPVVNGAVFGSIDGSSKNSQWTDRFGSSSFITVNGNGTGATSNRADFVGVNQVYRENTTQDVILDGGTITLTNNVSTALSNYSFYLLGRNSAGALSLPSDTEISFFSIGASKSAEHAAIKTIFE